MATEKFSLRAESRKDYTSSGATGGATHEDLQDGAILRIADAVERIASGKADLDTLAELERVKRFHAASLVERTILERRVSYWKGQVTRLKKKGA